MSVPDALQAALGDELGSVLSGAFEAMELADEAIEQHGHEVPGIFKMMRPSDVMHRAPKRLMRSHLRELCERADTTKDLREPTAAEFCAVLCALSLDAPLTPVAHVLYERKFALAFQGEDHGVQASFFADEHQVEELEGVFRRKLYQEWRQME